MPYGDPVVNPIYPRTLMHRCLLHQQEYPAGQWCVYCGPPAVRVTINPAGQTNVNVCSRCGQNWITSHVCMAGSLTAGASMAANAIDATGNLPLG